MYHFQDRSTRVAAKDCFGAFIQIGASIHGSTRFTISSSIVDVGKQAQWTIPRALQPKAPQPWKPPKRIPPGSFKTLPRYLFTGFRTFYPTQQQAGGLSHVLRLATHIQLRRNKSKTVPHRTWTFPGCVPLQESYCNWSFMHPSEKLVAIAHFCRGTGSSLQGNAPSGARGRSFILQL